jgi:hypothetical protein
MKGASVPFLPRQDGTITEVASQIGVFHENGDTASGGPPTTSDRKLRQRSRAGAYSHGLQDFCIRPLPIMCQRVILCKIYLHKYEILIHFWHDYLRLCPRIDRRPDPRCPA